MVISIARKFEVPKIDKPLKWAEGSDKLVEILRELENEFRISKPGSRLDIIGTPLDYVAASFVWNAIDSVRMKYLRIEHSDFSRSYTDAPGLYSFNFGSRNRRTSNLETDAGYKGECQIRFSVDDKKFRCEIEDNGIGIDPKIKPYIFTDEQVSTKDGLRGQVIGAKGIDLLQAKPLIERLGGKIGYVDKGANAGAIFWYEVPINAVKTVLYKSVRIFM